MIYLFFLFSIFVHELGHILMSKILNIEIGKIKLCIFGFSAKNIKLNGIKIKNKILFFVSGAIFNFIFAFIILQIKLDDYVKELIIYTNLVLGIFNLLPIIPLDGGNILRSILEYKFDLRKSMKISLSISKIFLFLLSMLYCIFVLVLKNIWIVFLIIYVWGLYIREERNFELYVKINKKCENLLSSDLENVNINRTAP